MGCFLCVSGFAGCWLLTVGHTYDKAAARLVASLVISLTFSNVTICSKLIVARDCCLAHST